eukprot:6972488-Pyramimonas_sp.AAC.1
MADAETGEALAIEVRNNGSADAEATARPTPPRRRARSSAEPTCVEACSGSGLCDAARGGAVL